MPKEYNLSSFGFLWNEGQNMIKALNTYPQKPSFYFVLQVPIQDTNYFYNSSKGLHHQNSQIYLIEKRPVRKSYYITESSGLLIEELRIVNGQAFLEMYLNYD